MDLRVLVAADNALARTGMEALLRTMPGVALLGSSGLPDAASMAAQLHPDAVLFDAEMGEPEDLEGIGRLAGAQPGIPIVALASRTSAAAQALAFGASALLPHDLDGPTLHAALLAAVRGLATVAHADLPGFLPPEDAHKPSPASIESLTRRELEVLQWMARGLTNRQIALRLAITEHTVKFHAASVLGKLGARSRAEAVARGIGQGWILV